MGVTQQEEREKPSHDIEDSSQEPVVRIRVIVVRVLGLGSIRVRVVRIKG